MREKEWRDHLQLALTELDDVRDHLAGAIAALRDLRRALVELANSADQP